MTPERYQHIWALYDEAEKLPPAERSIFLSHACVSDHALQQEVEALFAAEVAAANFLGTNAFAEAAKAYAAHPDPYHLAGRTVLDGKYQIETLVGRGGMGAVYKAQQTRIDRPVAFKILLPHLSYDEKALQSFWREGRLIGQLQHPHIVQVYDSGELTLDDVSYYYIVMEWVPGRTLAQELEETGPLSLDRSLHILQQVTDALEAAHAQNIVHLDLKPSNILLATTQAGAEQIKVVDFGIARIISGTDQLSARSNFGSLPYISPEQLAEKKVSARSDIFSLGVVLYEMLTGEVPFPTLQRTWPAPSIRGWRRDIPLLTDEYLQTFLSADPKARPRYLKSIPRNFENTFRVYQTRLLEGEQAFQAREYKQAIESWREALALAPDDAQVQERINAAQQEVQQEVERRREKQAEARRQKKARAEKLLREGDQAFRACQYAEARSAWKEVVRLVPKEMKLDLRMLIVEQIMQATARHNRLAAALEILLYNIVGRLLLMKDEAWVASWVRPYFPRALLIVGLSLGLLWLGAAIYLVWDASLEEGISYLERGEYKRAVSELELVIIKQNENAEAYLYRAKAYSLQQDHEHAIEDLTSYIRLRENDPQGYLLRGEALLRICKCDDAINDFKQAINFCWTVPDHYERLAEAHHQKGDLEGTIQAYTQKIQVEKGNPETYVTLAKIYLEKGLTELALEKLEQALLLKPDPQYYFIRGGVYFDLKDYDHAIVDYDR